MSECEDCAKHHKAELEVLRAENNRMAEMLLKIERRPGGFEYCNKCSFTKNQGHHKNCSLGQICDEIRKR